LSDRVSDEAVDRNGDDAVWLFADLQREGERLPQGPRRELVRGLQSHRIPAPCLQVADWCVRRQFAGIDLDGCLVGDPRLQAEIIELGRENLQQIFLRS